MSIWDQADFVRRIKAVLPRGWFATDSTPFLDTLLSGIGAIWAQMYLLMTYVAKQRRIATATDINLDVISSDFLGGTLPRKSGESDPAYSLRIRQSIFREMGTRHAISVALTQLTGAPPVIFEPANAADTGAYTTAGSGYRGLAYGKAGGYGSYELPFQAFVLTTLPQSITVAGVQGYGRAGATNPVVIGGYTIGAIEYASGDNVLFGVSDEEVYSVINAIKPIGTIIWVSTQETSIQGPGSVPGGGSGGGSGGASGGPRLDSSFILDVSRLSTATAQPVVAP